MGYVLVVALLTWGGVFFYMLRLEKLARSVEADVRRVEQQSAELSRTASAEMANADSTLPDTANADTAPREKELV